jgi:lipopolysaccharide heptosyltransferase II
MSESWATARNVLCVRLDNLGDVLMTTPAIRALKQSAPGRRVTLLTSRAGSALAPFLPDVDEAIAHDAPWVSHPAEPPLEADRDLLRRLAEHRFDSAVIFTVYSQSALPAALFCRLAGIPLRLAHCRENPYRLLTQWVPEPEPQRLVRHEVRRQLDLVANVGCRTEDERLVFRVGNEDRLGAVGKLRGAGVDIERPVLVVHAGASAPSRRYAPESFAAAARSLAGRSGYQIVFTGSREEAALVRRIRQNLPGSYSFAGKLSLGELAAVISLASLLVSNNTGPVHIAAAVGTPVVDLYALTNPQHGPWMVPHRMLYRDVPCRFCYKSVCPQGHHDCLRQVAPAEVVSAALQLLADGEETRIKAVPRAWAPTEALAMAG